MGPNMFSQQSDTKTGNMVLSQISMSIMTLEDPCLDVWKLRKQGILSKFKCQSQTVYSMMIEWCTNTSNPWYFVGIIAHKHNNITWKCWLAWFGNQNLPPCPANPCNGTHHTHILNDVSSYTDDQGKQSIEKTQSGWIVLKQIIKTVI